ncbi:acyltransferase family protein [Agromyces sp. NPDC056379]|uniref:acyltransferase family protein n=1 Tax=unclassified Agromyces TaxID=2639701 RepID=UPI0035E0D37A
MSSSPALSASTVAPGALRPTKDASKVMRDVQGLRAVAVAAVVIYHFWPERLPGGYVGVDVFFVISGFLITGHLLRELERSGGIDVWKFWARRVRRLLPMAFVVLAVTVVLVLTLVPGAQRTDNLMQIVASAFYFENWLLASNSVDYLASTNPPTLVQHYWSLSVEEQFYIVWPLVLLGVAWVAGRGRQLRTKRVVVIGVVIIAAASFAYSMWVTSASPSWAFFVTPARVWEFAAGALIAVLGLRVRAARWSDGLRIAVSWIGLAAIIVSCFAYNAATPFPGAAALLPVVGTALVIVAGQVDRVGSTTWIASAPAIQWVGDVSYSLYLWHWPLLLVLPALVGDRSGDSVVLVVLLAVVVLLSALSKRFIEDPMRGSGGRRQRSAPVFVSMAVVMALLSIVCLGAVRGIAAEGQAEEQRATELSTCLGAAREFAPDDADCASLVDDDDLFPLPAARLDDTELYECWSDEHEFGPVSCQFGPENAELRVALIGDSHAASLVPALSPAAEAGGWRLDTYLGIQCQPGQTGCRYTDHFSEQVRDGQYDAVIVSGYNNDQPTQEQLTTAWSEYLDQGISVIPVVDVPHISGAAYTCLDQGTTARELAACVTPRAEALEDPEFQDRYGSAAEALGLPAIDLTSWMCGPTDCPAVINNVIVYRDWPVSHLTATFARSLAPAMQSQLEPVLDGLRTE